MGDCKYCGKSAGFLRSKHRECDEAHKAGWQQIVGLVSQAATTIDFNEVALRKTLESIAVRAWMSNRELNVAIAQGWRGAVGASLADGILTQEEEERLRNFRDRMSVVVDPSNATALTQLTEGATNRLVSEARRVALEVDGAGDRLDDSERLEQLDAKIRESNLPTLARRQALVSAWEGAVETALEDGVPSLDEEAALERFLRYFDLEHDEVNVNGAYRRFVEGLVLRDVAEGTIPKRIRVTKDLPLNLQKSEQLVWVWNGVDYYELKTMRERRGESHGVSVRIARGLYYSPRQFRSRTYEWEEKVRLDRGILAVTSKHIYFHGARKRFRVRFDKVVSFDQLRDGFGLMRDAQTAKPQMFRTGDGWFVYNLVTNLARL